MIKVEKKKAVLLTLILFIAFSLMVGRSFSYSVPLAWVKNQTGGSVDSDQDGVIDIAEGARAPVGDFNFSGNDIIGVDTIYSKNYNCNRTVFESERDWDTVSYESSGGTASSAGQDSNFGVPAPSANLRANATGGTASSWAVVNKTLNLGKTVEADIKFSYNLTGEHITSQEPSNLSLRVYNGSTWEEEWSTDSKTYWGSKEINLKNTNLEKIQFRAYAHYDSSSVSVFSHIDNLTVTYSSGGCIQPEEVEDLSGLIENAWTSAEEHAGAGLNYSGDKLKVGEGTGLTVGKKNVNLDKDYVLTHWAVLSINESIEDEVHSGLKTMNPEDSVVLVANNDTYNETGDNAYNFTRSGWSSTLIYPSSVIVKETQSEPDTELQRGENYTLEPCIGRINITDVNTTAGDTEDIVVWYKNTPKKTDDASIISTINHPIIKNTITIENPTTGEDLEKGKCKNYTVLDYATGRIKLWRFNASVGNEKVNVTYNWTDFSGDVFWNATEENIQVNETRVVSTQDDRYVNEIGDTMEGDLSLGGYQLKEIGSGLTNFTSTGGLDLAGSLNMNGNINNFFSGGCSDNEHVTGISTDGSINCGMDTGNVTDITADSHLTGGGVGGSLTLDVSDDWVDIGGDTMSGPLNMSGHRILKIGSGLTNFTSTGGLDLAGSLNMKDNNITSLDGIDGGFTSYGSLNMKGNRISESGSIDLGGSGDIISGDNLFVNTVHGATFSPGSPSCGSDYQHHLRLNDYCTGAGDGTLRVDLDVCMKETSSGSWSWHNVQSWTVTNSSSCYSPPPSCYLEDTDQNGDGDRVDCTDGSGNVIHDCVFNVETNDCTTCDTDTCSCIDSPCPST